MEITRQTFTKTQVEVAKNDLVLATKLESSNRGCLSIMNGTKSIDLYFTTIHIGELEDLVRKLKEVRDCSSSSSATSLASSSA